MLKLVLYKFLSKISQNIICKLMSYTLMNLALLDPPLMHRLLLQGSIFLSQENPTRSLSLMGYLAFLILKGSLVFLTMVELLGQTMCFLSLLSFHPFRTTRSLITLLSSLTIIYSHLHQLLPHLILHHLFLPIPLLKLLKTLTIVTPFLIWIIYIRFYLAPLLFTLLLITPFFWSRHFRQLLQITILIPYDTLPIHIPYPISPLLIIY